MGVLFTLVVTEEVVVGVREAPPPRFKDGGTGLPSSTKRVRIFAKCWITAPPVIFSPILAPIFSHGKDIPALLASYWIAKVNCLFIGSAMVLVCVHTGTQVMRESDEERVQEGTRTIPAYEVTLLRTLRPLLSHLFGLPGRRWGVVWGRWNLFRSRWRGFEDFLKMHHKSAKGSPQ